MRYLLKPFRHTDGPADHLDVAGFAADSGREHDAAIMVIVDIRFHSTCVSTRLPKVRKLSCVVGAPSKREENSFWVSPK